MQILIITDKFKYTFSSLEIANLIEFHLKNKNPNIKTIKLPVSDGGQGFLEAIEFSLKAKRIYLDSVNPIGQKIQTYFLIDDQKNVFIECSKTCGIDLIKKYNKNPLKTTSYGLGLIIKKALELEPKKIFIGLGGSATNDLGLGMLNALGFKFLDEKKNEIFPIPLNFNKIKQIIFPQNNFETQIIALTDVKNPLLGKNGAAYTFARQKGATAEDIEFLENSAQRFADFVLKKYNIKLNSFDGEGAAGGIASAIKHFLNGEIYSGADFILNLLNAERFIKNANFIITGEGKLDKTSFSGKIVGEVYNLALKYNKIVFVICGIAEIIKKYNLFVFPLFKKPLSPILAKKFTDKKLEKVIGKILLKIEKLKF